MMNAEEYIKYQLKDYPNHEEYNQETIDAISSFMEGYAKYYHQQQVKNCDLADVGERNLSSRIFDMMCDQNISQETYDALGNLHDEICDPVNKGNWPIRININYV